MANPTLTPLIASPSDLRRTRRELEALDEFLRQSSLRQGGKEVKMPTVSRIMEDLATDSDLNLLKKTDRERLMKFITLLIQKAPVVHMTFASEPSAKAMAKLISWMRENLHPQIVVSIGVQPSIAAGCMLRTTNRQFNFTLREALDDQTENFIKNLRFGLNDDGVIPTTPAVSSESAAPAGSTEPAGAAK
jgi:F0F1-type ATP synthase delta subunit